MGHLSSYQYIINEAPSPFFISLVEGLALRLKGAPRIGFKARRTNVSWQPLEKLKMGQKRKYDDGVMRDSAHLEGDMPSYTSIFESFREDLDEHHDRRQRIIKASKDITAASKKM